MEKKRILMDFVEARNFYDCPQMLFLCSSISIVSLLSPREWTSPEKMRSVPVLVISPRSHTTNRIIGGTKKGSGLESKKIFVREACPWISSSHKLSCAWKTLPSVWSRTVQSSTTVPTTKPHEWALPTTKKLMRSFIEVTSKMSRNPAMGRIFVYILLSLAP